MPSFLCESSPTGQYTSYVPTLRVRASVAVTLKVGTYDVYCPVGEDSHKKLGMETHLAATAGRSSSGYGDSEIGRSKMSEVSESRAMGEEVQSIRVTSGGPVILSLPAPFPLPPM